MIAAEVIIVATVPATGRPTITGRDRAGAPGRAGRRTDQVDSRAPGRIH